MKELKLLDETAVAAMTRRLAAEVLEQEATEGLVVVGIRRRGVPLAKRLAKEVEALSGKALPVGVLDITFYRDDLTKVAESPEVKGSEIPFEVEGKTVLLVDDVLYTGRTVRAAMEELLDYGRYAALRLLVLVDRGHGELPIRADHVGKEIETRPDEVVEVRLSEIDGEDSVVLLREG